MTIPLFFGPYGSLDGPASLRETAAATLPSWGLQVFGGTSIFGDPARAQV